MTLSGIPTTDYNSDKYVHEVIVGKLDIISLTLTFYLFMFLVVFSTWAGQGFQAEYDLLLKMGQFALIGFMVHSIINIAMKDPPLS